MNLDFSQENGPFSRKSHFYYAFMFLPSALKQDLLAIYHLFYAIEQHLFRLQEPMMSQTQLLWWKQHLLYAFDSPSCVTHPLVARLVPLISRYSLNKSNWIEYIDGHEMRIHHAHFKNEATLAQYTELIGGSMLIITAQLLGATKDSTALFARQLGSAIEMTALIEQAPKEAKKGRLIFPQDLLAQHQVDAQTIFLGQEGFEKQLLPVWNDYTQKIRGLYQNAFSHLSSDEWNKQKPLIILATLYQEWLLQIAKRQYPVFRQSWSLSPLKQWWIASKIQAFSASS